MRTLGLHRNLIPPLMARNIALSAALAMALAIPSLAEAGGRVSKQEIHEIGQQINAVSLMQHMLAVDIAIKNSPPCSNYNERKVRMEREIKRLNEDTSLSDSDYDAMFNLRQSRLNEFKQQYKQCFLDKLPAAAKRFTDVRGLGALSYDNFEKKYSQLKKPYYGNRPVISFEDDIKRLIAKRDGLVMLWLEDEIKEVRDFRGTNEQKPSRGTWENKIKAHIDVLVLNAKRYHDITKDVFIPGETEADRWDGIVKGYAVNASLGLESGRMILLLSGDYLPNENRHNNPYAAWTATTEEPLRRKILTSPTGALLPGDILELALDVSGGNYPLAVMTAHAVLKTATKKGRDVIETMVARGRGARWELIPELAKQLKPHSDIALRLRNIRPDDDKTGDKLGPWYHGFGILSAGALSSPAGAKIGAWGEHLLKLMGDFKGEGSYNREKEFTDNVFASAAMSLFMFNRYHDPDRYNKNPY